MTGTTQHSSATPQDTTSTGTADPDATPASAMGLVDVDPAELLGDRNVRTGPTEPGRSGSSAATRTLVASIREHGVLVPIVAVRLPDGQLRVRMGHRRTLAAVEVGLGSVPVLIAGTDQDGDSAERVVQQWAENEHRAALSTGERIGAVAQLAAFGLTAASIARWTKTPRAGIDAALTAARSQVAVQTADDHQLTLEEAAVVAEFDADDGAVADLLRTAGSGQFAHTVQRMRDLRAEAADRAVMEDAAREAGLTVLPYTMNLPRPVTLLRSLLDGDGDELDPAVHTGCPGHALMARRVWNPCSLGCLERQRRRPGRGRAGRRRSRGAGRGHQRVGDDRGLSGPLGQRPPPALVARTDPAGRGGRPGHPP